MRGPLLASGEEGRVETPTKDPVHRQGRIVFGNERFRVQGLHAHPKHMTFSINKRTPI